MCVKQFIILSRKEDVYEKTIDGRNSSLFALFGY